MSELNSERNKIKTINDLCGAENSKKYNFIIPAYQRGYRWTPAQVNDLLNDIDENPKNKQYCLQPLVVKEHKNSDDTCSYELIDGQQRLTTFYLILCALAAPKITSVFSLSTARTVEYKSLDTNNRDFTVLQKDLDNSISFFDALKKFVSRKNNEENDISQLSYNSFFQVLQENEDYENIDRFYLLQAINIILTHYYDADGNFRIAGITADTLINRIKENFYFLWYKTDSPNDNQDSNTAEAAFSRLNSGKISLNNADLIKALLLRRENLITEKIDGADEKWLEGWLETQRTEIISQWDNMEQILRSDEDRFWNFIVEPEKLNRSNNSYFSRLEIIFDLQMGTDENQNNDTYQQYRIYRFFEKQVKERVASCEKSITSQIWSETVSIFNIMREWYEDHKLYHYIGYLSCLPIKEYIAADTNCAAYPADFVKNKFSSWLQVLTALVQNARVHSKEEFLAVVKTLVRWSVVKRMKFHHISNLNDLLSRLTYDKNKEGGDPSTSDGIEDKNFIKFLLLLCNVQELITSTNMREADHKFPFKFLKIQNEKKLTLTLEHILPQNLEFTASNNQEKTTKELKDIYQKLYKQLEYYGLITEKYLKNTINNADCYKDCIDELWKIANPPTQEMNAQRFYNLTLLPFGINASLSNHIFPEKRNELLRATESQYIPLSTQHVFLKRYSWRKDEQAQALQVHESPLFWLESDAIAYRNAMVDLLSEFDICLEEMKGDVNE